MQDPGNQDPEKHFVPGALVQLHSLKSREHNNKCGVIISDVGERSDDGRRLVSLLPWSEDDSQRNADAKRILVRNLLLVCSWCMALVPGKRCTLCHAAAYCNAECQRVQWPTHKGLCKDLRNGRPPRKPHLKDATSPSTPQPSVPPPPSAQAADSAAHSSPSNGSQAAAASEDTWACPKCTFENPKDDPSNPLAAYVCGACDMPRPAVGGGSSAGGDGGTSVQAPSRPNTWVCNICTFENEESARTRFRCEACEQDRPAHLVPKHALLKEFIPGSRVELHSIRNKPELNGKSGMVTEFLSETGRYSVKLDNSVLPAFKVKPANLKRIGVEDDDDGDGDMPALEVDTPPSQAASARRS